MENVKEITTEDKALIAGIRLYFQNVAVHNNDTDEEILVFCEEHAELEIVTALRQAIRIYDKHTDLYSKVAENDKTHVNIAGKIMKLQSKIATCGHFSELKFDFGKLVINMTITKDDMKNICAMTTKTFGLMGDK